mgnify:CR=1 FL=1|tara:strand:+ start:1514 stop:1696 length:183 start_codon:yes stop_codon:yes gene_type:complete
MAGENKQYIVSEQATKDIVVMRKIELLVDVLRAVEDANSPDVYGVKLNIIDKLDRAVSQL